MTPLAFGVVGLWRARLLGALVVVFLVSAVPVASAALEVPKSMPAAEADGASGEPSVSGDGRYVAFVSEASNLVFGDSNGTADVFVRDRVTGQTGRVSVSSGGGEANAASSAPAISPDGRFVAFVSEASDLVSGDSNGVSDVFVADRVGGQTARVSLSSAGGQANGQSSEPSVSADGRLVAFVSEASNLVSGDSNGVSDVFVADRVGGQTARVSVSVAGGEANGASVEPSISGDGRLVAFRSVASNLVSGDTNGAADVFVRDRVAGAGSLSGGGRNPLDGVLVSTARVSVDSWGGQVGGASSEPSISADGGSVAFTSSADLAGGGDGNAKPDVYVRDRVAQTTVFASVGLSGNARSASLSGDGSYVAFVADSPYRLPSGATDVYERDLPGNFTARLSLDDDALVESDGVSGAPSLSADATFAAFSSQASNLVPGSSDTNGVQDIFLHTWSANVDASASGSAGDSPTQTGGGSGPACTGGASGGSGAGDAPEGPSGRSAGVPVRRTGQRCDLSPISPGLELPQGGCGEGDLAANPSACRADPVNTATGSYITEVTDLALRGVGLPFALVRAYNSGDPTVGALGRGWTHSYAMFLSVRDAGAVVVARGQSGQRLAFTRLAGGSYAPAANGRATLATTAGGWELVRRDQVRYRFDWSGRLTGVIDRNGQDLQLAYDAGGRLSMITDTVGRQVALSYTGGLLTQVALPDGRRVSYAYTGGLLSSVTDVRGATTRYEYAGGRLSKVIDQNNHAQITNVYGPGGRVSSQTDALGEQTAFAWDAKTRTATVRDPRGEEWRDVYSSSYELVRETDPLGNRSAYTYDGDSNLVAVQDPRENTTEMAYDKDANLLSRTDALGQSETFTYNARNDPVTRTNPRGLTTAFDYDAQGNLVWVTEPGAVVTTLGRDPGGTGLLTSVTDPRGKTETYAHDGQGNLTSVTSPKGFRATFGYDGSGRLTSAVDPRGNASGANPADYRTTFGYDAGDHPTSETDPLGNQTRWTYDPAGELKTTVDAKNRTTSYGYDDLNRLTLVSAPDSTSTAYTYNETGQLTTRTDAKDHTTSYGYDPARRLVSQTTPAGRRSTYAYDAASNRTARTDAQQNTTAYAYDRLDRLAGIDYAGSSTPDVTFGYDQNSNRVLMRDGEGTETYAYDQLDRLSKLVRGARVFSYDYDAASNVTGRRFPDGRTVDYTYDDDDRLDTVTSAGQTTSYAYDPAARPTWTVLPNGYEETRGYDRAGRLTELENRRGATVLSRFAYTLDEVGNPTLVQSPGATTSYAYDARDRLKEACYQASCPTAGDPFIRYGYDAVGNRTTETRPSGTTSYNHNPDDQLTAKTAPTGTTTYDHDPNGNLTRAGTRTYNYNYDLENRITSTSSAGQTTSYRYDGQGTRTEETTGNDKTQLVWDKNNALPQLIAEEDPAGNPQRQYLHGNDLISMSAAGQAHYYHRDALGSTTNLTAAGGNSEWSYSYEPFGAARQTQKLDPQAPENPIRFTGERLDANSGLYHLRARDLDPQDGRFTTTDPIAPDLERPYTSAYAYANNQPTTHTDPSGLSVWATREGGTPFAGNTPGRAAGSLSLGGPSWALDRGGLGELLDEKPDAYPQLLNSYVNGDQEPNQTAESPVLKYGDACQNGAQLGAALGTPVGAAFGAVAGATAGGVGAGPGAGLGAIDGFIQGSLTGCAAGLITEAGLDPFV